MLQGQYSPPAMNNADTCLFILHVNTEAASDCDSPHWAGGMGSLVGAELSYQWLQHALSFAIHIHLVYNIDKSLFMSQPNKNSTVSIP